MPVTVTFTGAKSNPRIAAALMLEANLGLRIKANGYNVALVQKLLQHSSTAVTQRYIGIQQKELEAAIENHLYLDI